MSFQSVTLIYDGGCGFCIRSLRLLRALDWFGVCRYIASQDPSITTRFPAFSATDFDEAMYAVSEDGVTYRGFFAFRRALRAMPAAWLLLGVFYFPGASVVGPRVYGWVARNRSRLGCTSTCALPSAPSRRTPPQNP